MTIEVNHLFCYDLSEPKKRRRTKVVHFEGRCYCVTNMKRTTISFPDELTERIFSLRKDNRFIRCSYSELIRQLAERGLEMIEQEAAQSRHGREG